LHWSQTHQLGEPWIINYTTIVNLWQLGLRTFSWRISSPYGKEQPYKMTWFNHSAGTIQFGSVFIYWFLEREKVRVGLRKVRKWKLHSFCSSANDIKATKSKSVQYAGRLGHK
jgi:hypothetical protein